MTSQHILIVEDEPNTAEMLTAYFESQGYDVTALEYGEKALAFVRDTLPDLVVLDIRLPDINGYEICRQLRSHRRTAHVPIIFLTEKRERIDRLAGLELGAVDYVTKPFDVQELRLRVRNVLRRSNLEPVAHPITGLPFAALAEEHLAQLLGEKQWAIVAVKLNGLDAFDEVYGFVARDDVLRALALMIRRTASEDVDKDSFLGQLGETIFFLITSPECAPQLRKRLESRLEEALVFFYPRADWEAGQSSAGDPLPRLSIETCQLTGPGPYQDVEGLEKAIESSLASVPS